jgi:hypothetical protein
MGVGAAMVCVDLLALNSKWVPPTCISLILGIFVCVPCFEYIFQLILLMLE